MVFFESKSSKRRSTMLTPNTTSWTCPASARSRASASSSLASVQVWNIAWRRVRASRNSGLW
jgi:hypothetical protein